MGPALDLCPAADVMKPCISEATTLSAPFADDVAAYAEAGWPAMEVWLTKL